MASKKGYLLPEVINPPGRRCVTFYVPDDQLWWAAFWGQMSALLDTWMWEGTDAQKAEVTDVWLGVYNTARQNWLDGECTLPLEFRVVNGRVEYRPDPSAQWTDIGVACGCEPVIPSPEYNQDVTTFDQRACNIAVGLVDWIMEKFGDAVDEIEAAADVVSSFDAIIAMMPPAYLIADVVLDMINEVIEAGVAVARAFDTETHRDEMKRFLYCEMYFTGEMTSDIWASFLTWADDEYNHFPLGAGWACWDFWARSVDVAAIIARARIVSYEESDCIEFGCGVNWEQVFDFKAEQSLLGWTARSPFPTPTIVANGLLAGVHLDTGASPDFSTRRVDMTHPTPYPDVATRITEAVMFYSSVTLGNGNSVAAPTVTIRLWNAANSQIEAPTPLNQSISIPDGNKTLTFPGTAPVLDTYKMFMALVATERSSNTAQPVTGSGTLEKVIIRGLGKNPFVA